MKTRFLILLFSVIFFSACSDDDSKTTANELTFKGKAYPITTLRYDSLEASLTNYTLSLGPDASSQLNLVFPPTGEIPDGTYTFRSIDDPDFDPDVHFSGGALYDYPQNLSVMITNGTVRFSKIEQQYKVVIDVKTAEGRVKGTYKGPLTQI